ncbi:MAG: DUF3179 domain-containing protein [Acidobacteriia bacterium]|nr:DUF3179 domain-containing protein [Terriglobia bacterium]
MRDSPPPRPGFLRSGGWVVVAAVAVATVGFAFHARYLVRHRARLVGDGRRVESYGFSLTPCRVPRELVVASGMPKDGLRALVDPPSWTTAQADAATTKHAKFLVAGDRVLGLQLNGQARAYPLRMLVWHEAVNDTLGGVAVAVTYNPLCDSAAAFRRDVRGLRRTFGVSGLLYDSNLLMYDRQPGGKGESLWSQLLFRAVAGPAAADGLVLAALPISVEGWADWRRAHPDTTVLAPDPDMAEKYASDPYTNYFGSDQLRFPVQPLPSPAAWPLKTPVVAIGGAQGWTAFPFPELKAAPGSLTSPPAPWAALASALTYRAQGRTVAVVADALPPDAAVVYASYFAWYATHRDDTVWAAERR